MCFETPDLYYAYEFYEEWRKGPRRRCSWRPASWPAKAFDTIAEVMGITPGTVEWYEYFFFNVVDRLNQGDWITNQVLLPALQWSPLRAAGSGSFRNNEVVKPFLDGSLKLFAYFGGPRLIDVLLAGFNRASRWPCPMT